MLRRFLSRRSLAKPGRAFLLALALASLAAAPSLANEPVAEPQQRGSDRGNEGSTGTGNAPPRNYGYATDFFGMILSGLDPLTTGVIITSRAMMEDELQAAIDQKIEELRGLFETIPTESILDDIDSDPSTMMGGMFGATADPTSPPPESILDDIPEPTLSEMFGGSAPAPEPAPAPTAEQQEQIDKAAKRAAANKAFADALNQFGTPEVKAAMQGQPAAVNQAPGAKP
jgi:hypothetical protein